jgi:hypothetical protein
VTTPGVHDFTVNPTSGLGFVDEPIVTQYGNPNAYTNLATGVVTSGGGSLRCNGNLRLHGLITPFLDAIGHDEDWEIAGNLTFDGFKAVDQYGNAVPLSSQPTQLIDSGTSAYSPPFVTPSNGGATYPFNTLGGKYRDGSMSNDIDNDPRAIQYLTAPSLSVVDPNSGLTRYAALTQVGSDGSGVQPDGSTQYAGPYKAGAPSTVLIDNTADSQQESTGTTLRDEWLNPQPSIVSEHWRGDFYVPPAATIVFGAVPGVTIPVSSGQPLPVWGFTITRDDRGENQEPTWTWHTSNGKIASAMASRMRFIYASSLPSGVTFDPTDPIYCLQADNRSAPSARATIRTISCSQISSR